MRPKPTAVRRHTALAAGGCWPLLLRLLMLRLLLLQPPPLLLRLLHVSGLVLVVAAASRWGAAIGTPWLGS